MDTNGKASKSRRRQMYDGKCWEWYRLLSYSSERVRRMVEQKWGAKESQKKNAMVTIGIDHKLWRITKEFQQSQIAELWEL